MDWLLHRGKCYWLSKTSQNWSESRSDCEMKNSQLLVIQNQDEEMVFIQNITEGEHLVWLGVRVTFPEGKWMWVDGSPLNQPQLPGPAESNSCGVIKKNQIRSDICNTKFKWICRKEALLI
uniref:C-type lectin domain-containing protein n=1 Tax=Chrysemys picta bellii TaxID=8478 RepID=A0A8C3HXA7_CHRPI